MTAFQAQRLRQELAALRAATTTIPAFRARHATRAAEIEAELAADCAEPEVLPRDAALERCLCIAGGGDALDRGAARRRSVARG